LFLCRNPTFRKNPRKYCFTRRPTEPEDEMERGWEAD
jgi:hypothetical protein